MKHLQDAPDIRIRGWIVVLAVAGLAQSGSDQHNALIRKSGNDG